MKEKTREFCLTLFEAGIHIEMCTACARERRPLEPEKLALIVGALVHAGLGMIEIRRLFFGCYNNMRPEISDEDISQGRWDHKHNCVMVRKLVDAVENS